MGTPIDYSKWENLELSDDEDTHPGAQFIEESTLRRMKRMTHERNEKERAEKEEEARKRLQEAEEKLKRLEVRKGKGDTTEELEKEMSEAKREKEEEESEIERLQRQKRFNAEEACKVSKEKTFVGGPEEAKEPWKDMTYDQFVSEYKGAMNDYIGIDRSLDDAESFLEDHPMLLTEHALGYMLMVALDHGMHGNKKAMRRVVKNKYHVKSILDFTNETQHQPQSFVNKFFQRLRSSASMEKEYWRNFEDLLSKLEERAREKVREGEYDTDEQEQALSKEERLGPGGLDPVEVFEELPEPIQTAYENRDTESLREYVNNLPMEEAKSVMRKMVDSGLWIPDQSDPGAAVQAAYNS